MTIFAICLICLSALFLGAVILMQCKNRNTYKNLSIIVEAISKYNQHAIKHAEWDKCISYDEMRSYDDTLYRLWDWGYENILPKELFERVKPFIKKD